MMELHEALNEVAFIRRQLGHARVFRGYRSSAAVASSLLAGGFAAAQARWVPDPALQLGAYVRLWASAAALAILGAAGPMVGRALRHASPLLRDKTFSALGMLAPCVAAGGILTTVLMMTDPSVLWILPGLWAVLFGLGLFASLPVLPRPMSLVAGYYVAAGSAALYLGHGPWAFSPWMMVWTFGAGQVMAAGVLYWCLERRQEGERDELE